MSPLGLAGVDVTREIQVARSRADMRITLRSPNRTSPERGASNPAKVFNKVDLPDPLRPTTTKADPGGRLKWSSAPPSTGRLKCSL